VIRIATKDDLAQPRTIRSVSRGDSGVARMAVKGSHRHSDDDFVTTGGIPSRPSRLRARPRCLWRAARVSSRRWVELQSHYLGKTAEHFKGQHMKVLLNPAVNCVLRGCVT
jgi:hypothetical protein